jgi:IS1 family transposase
VEKVAEPVVPQRIADLELDEFWSFVERKKRQRWTWYAFDRTCLVTKPHCKGPSDT